MLLLGEQRSGKSSILNMLDSQLTACMNLIEAELPDFEAQILNLGIDSAIFVMKQGAISAATLELFRRLERVIGVPIVLVVTHCEFEDGNAWIAANKDAFAELGTSPYLSRSLSIPPSRKTEMGSRRIRCCVRYLSSPLLWPLLPPLPSFFSSSSSFFLL